MIQLIEEAQPQTPTQIRNPVLPVYAADPHIFQDGDRYFLASTNAGIYASMHAFEQGEAGEEGHGFALWSSPDLQTWQDEGAILRFCDVSWARDLDRAWAPCTASRNGRTFFYFCAGDRIGVAVGDSPRGPFRDALGTPLIAFRPDLSAIDPMVFVDDDGQAYLFWGAVPAAWLHGQVEPILNHLSVQKLAPDMVTLQGEEVPTIETPPAVNGHNGFGPHMEASHVIKRGGVYYLMFSQGSWSNPNDEFLYHVRYATAPHPLGPWAKQPNVVLSTRCDFGLIGPGHHSTLQMPGSDEWFIVYHAHNGDCDRRVYINRMEFGPDGAILPVTLSLEAPPARPIKLALQLEGYGPFAGGEAIRFHIRAHQPLQNIEIFDGEQSIGAAEGDATRFEWPNAPIGFHRVWAQGVTKEGKTVSSSALDLDVR